MAYSIYQGGQALIGAQQLQLEKRKQDFIEKQAQRGQGFARDLYDVLKEGILLANQITGLQSNLAAIDQAKAQAGLAGAQQEQVIAGAQQKQRIARGEFQTPFEAAQAGFQVAPEGYKYKVGESPLQASVGGESAVVFKPLDPSQQVELEKKRMDLAVKEKELQQDRLKQEAQQKAEIANNSKELRKEYNAHPQVKEFSVIDQNYKQVLSSAKKQAPSGADDLKLITSYIKILDPNSVVREGEIANVTKSSGLIDTAVSYYNRVRGGGTLDNNIRNQILSAAQDAYSDVLVKKQELDNWYGSIAQKKGFDITEVLPKSAISNLNISTPQGGQVMIPAQDLQGPSANFIPEANAAALSGFNPDIFASKREAIKAKPAMPKPKRGPGILR